VWGKRAEGQLQNYLKKGQQVFVSGELSQSEYRANDGSTKTSLELNCNILDLVGGKKEGGQQSPAPGKPAQQQTKQQKIDESQFDDDIPF
jgi:single-strand DNA-binding protein